LLAFGFRLVLYIITTTWYYISLSYNRYLNTSLVTFIIVRVFFITKILSVLSLFIIEILIIVRYLIFLRYISLTFINLLNIWLSKINKVIFISTIYFAY
jgi:hypothetical protein